MLKFLFNKVAGTKKRLQYRCFSVNIAKFLRAPICGYCEIFKNIYFKSFCSAFISSWRLSCRSSKLLSQKPVSVRLSDYLQCSGKEIFNFLIKVMVALTKSLQRLSHRRFLVNFAKFLRTSFLTEHLRWMLLHFITLSNNIKYVVYSSTVRFCQRQLPGGVL